MRHFIFSVLFFIFIVPLYGNSSQFATSELVSVNSDFNAELIAGKMYVIADTLSAFDSVDVLHVCSERWKKCTDKGFAKPFNDYTYWVKVNIDCSKSGSYYLENDYPIYDTYQFYLYNKKAKKFEEINRIQTDLPTGKLELKKGIDYVVYFSVKRRYSALHSVFKLYDTRSYTVSRERIGFDKGVIFCFYFLIILASLIFWIKLKERIYFYYAMYNILIFLYQLTVLNLLPGTIKYGPFMVSHFLAIFSFVFLFLVVIAFLKPKKIVPKSLKFSIVTLIIVLLIIVVKAIYYYLFPSSFTLFFQIASTIVGFAFPISFFVICFQIYFKTKSTNALLLSLTFLITNIYFVVSAITPFQVISHSVMVFFKWGVLAESVMILVIIIRDLINTKLDKQRLEMDLITQKSINTTRYMKGQSAERKRFASQLHDSINLKLSSLKMQLSNHNIDEKIVKQLDDVNAEIRSISHSLSPVSLERNGLVNAINEVIFKLEDSYPDLIIEFKYPHQDFRASTRNEELCYWTCLELLNNTIKHSGASKICIELAIVDLCIELSVEDNGVGFDYESIKHKKGIGLQNVYDRAFLVDGTFEVKKLEKGVLQIFKLPTD